MFYKVRNVMTLQEMLFIHQFWVYLDKNQPQLLLVCFLMRLQLISSNFLQIIITSLLKLMKLMASLCNLKHLKVNEHPSILLHKPMVNCNSNLLALNETCDLRKVIIIYNREVRHEESLEQTNHLQNSLVNESERQN